MDPLRDKYRPLWTILFVIAVLICVSTVSAQSPQLESQLTKQASSQSAIAPFQSDEAEGSVAALQNPFLDDLETIAPGISLPSGATENKPGLTLVQYAGGRAWLPVAQSQASPRNHANSFTATKAAPKTLRLTGSLENYDDDPNDDGWRVRIEFLDSQGKPTPPQFPNLSVTFKILPLIPASDNLTSVPSDSGAMKWSAMLAFDRHGVAAMTLANKRTHRNNRGKLTRYVAAQQRHHSYPTAIPGGRLSSAASSNAAFDSAVSHNRGKSVARVAWYRNHQFNRDAILAHVANPSHGLLTANVLVPSVGLFSARTIVALRSPVLVDTPSTDR